MVSGAVYYIFTGKLFNNRESCFTGNFNFSLYADGQETNAAVAESVPTRQAGSWSRGRRLIVLIYHFDVIREGLGWLGLKEQEVFLDWIGCFIVSKLLLSSMDQKNNGWIVSTKRGIKGLLLLFRIEGKGWEQIILWSMAKIIRRGWTIDNYYWNSINRKTHY